MGWGMQSEGVTKLLEGTQLPEEVEGEGNTQRIFYQLRVSAGTSGQETEGSQGLQQKQQGVSSL